MSLAMTTTVRGKRKRVHPKNPNPLFCEWLQEWKAEAEAKGWKLMHTYGKALSSLKKYPLKLDRGKDCKILTHFGDKICGMLDKKLDAHMAAGSSLNSLDENSDNDGPTAGLPRKTSAAKTTSDYLDAASSSSTQPIASSKPRRSSSGGRAYIPAYRSGSYAIIVTLYQYTQVEGRGEYLTKKDLIRLAQPLCDKSLTSPDVGTYYTGFSSMSTLITKGLVDKFSSPAKYRLTNEGVILAQTLISQSPSANPSTSALSPTSPTQSPLSDRPRAKAVKGRKPKPSNTFTIQSDIQCSVDDILPSTSSAQSYQPMRSPETQSEVPIVSTTHDISATPLFSLHPSQYDILLVVDNREHFGFGAAKQQILPSLVKNAVKFDVRPISVGDFVWIAQEKYGAKREAVLDFIVERKRLDDLSGSIVDGRYKEQKLRMKKSGLRKPIYLIEYYKTQEHERIKEDALHQAVMNTQIIDEFYVKRCNNIKESIAYLTLLHNQIVKLYKNKIIHTYSQDGMPDLPFNPGDAEMCHMTYGDFNSSGVKSKPPTVTESWKRMLMCIPGVSLDKANVIVEHYPTLNSLVGAYGKCQSDKERIKLLSSFKSGPTGRKIGDVLSRNIFNLFYSSSPLP